MSSKKPILLTGSHRSGSTWVGKMIAASDEVGYLHEPFNPKRGARHSPGNRFVRFDRWFTYVCEENSSAYRGGLQRILSFDFDPARGLAAVRSPGDLRKLVNDFRVFSKYRREGARPLMKDPVALFSAEWLAKEFDMDVVVLIRHPAAFAGSLKAKGWAFPFADLLEQPLLMRDLLGSFEEEMRDHAGDDHDIIDQAVLFWRLAHSVIEGYKERHDDWLFIRHEDLSRDPLEGFERLFEELGLGFTPKVERAVVESSGGGGPGSAGSAGVLSRDSKANIWAWKDRLAPGEIERIRSGVEDVSRFFYSDEDW